MISCDYSWEIKVTHEPTGMSQTITNRHIRSQHKAREQAIETLTNRMRYAILVDSNRDKELIHDYRVDDQDDLYPDDLKEYKIIDPSN